MAELRELEERLAQCRMVIGNVLQNMNYIQKEIDSIKKAGDPSQNTSSDTDKRPGDLQMDRQGEWQGMHQATSSDNSGAHPSVPRAGL